MDSKRRMERVAHGKCELAQVCQRKTNMYFLRLLNVFRSSLRGPAWPRPVETGRRISGVLTVTPAAFRSLHSSHTCLCFCTAYLTSSRLSHELSSIIENAGGLRPRTG